MTLNLNHAVKVIRQLFMDMMGTSAFTLDIKKVEKIKDKQDIYEISLEISPLNRTQESKYIIQYNANQNIIEDLKETPLF